MKTYLKLFLFLCINLFPFLAYAQSLTFGGVYGAGAKIMEVDGEGNTYLSGFITEEAKIGDFFIKEKDGKYFLTKINKNGEVKWVKSFPVNIQDITIIKDANIIVAGQFREQITIDNQQLISKNNFDVFLASFNTDGQLIWTQQISGTDEVLIKSLDKDSKGNIYLTGNFTGSIHFPNQIMKNLQAKNIYLAKYSSEGKYIWAKQATGGNNLFTGIHVWKNIIDNSDNVILVGTIIGQASFENQKIMSSHELFYGEGWVYNADVFIAKYSPEGNLFWAKNVAHNTDVTDITCDSEKNIYITGYIRGSQNLSNKSKFGIAYFGKQSVKVNPTKNTQAIETVFVAKYSVAGNISWVKTIVGKGSSRASKILYDIKNKKILLCGFFQGELKNNDMILESSNEYLKVDVFLATFDLNGNLEQLAQGYGDETEEIADAKFDKNNQLLIIGRFKRLFKIYDFILQTDGNSSNGFWAKIKIQKE
jgi:hypothetical protein